MGSRFIDIAGQKFGRLTAVRSVSKDGRHHWLCNCDCGKQSVVSGKHIRTGHTRSCGCLYMDHDLTHTPEYRTWANMLSRCRNAKVPNYPQYGGRGIAVCDRWLDFMNFYSDMGPRPSKQHSLDRIKNSGGYEPGNCRWATDLEQMRNTRYNRNLTFNGQTKCISEWAEIAGMGFGTLYHRLYRYGWSVERALTTPIKRAKR
jgi:hypothetical protein